ncbi:MAG: PRC-barrel domain-containing protein [Candidatus Nanoarchaeia archaeon]|nr:PRC-barrel domain-containing protein [Candidatus Nanoarchaeia archaeon]
MLKIKQVTDVYDMQVFTDTGEYFGDVEEAILQGNKVYGWRIRATRNSFLTKLLGGAKGVVVPHNLVKAIGDVMVVSKSAVPAYDENEETGQTTTEM